MASTSAALAFLAESHLDLVRPGLSLYGVPPVPTSADDPDGETLPARPAPFPLRAALSLKARVVQVHALPAGDTVGYGHTFRTRRDSRIALLPLGYADGLSRALSNRGWALLHGYRVPIVGRVSMDQVCVDVTDLPDAAVGDEAVLIGSQGNETITAWEVGLAMHSIAYEALVSLSARLPRVYRG